MSVNDQYNMARIPIRPLALSNKELASTKELIIDNLGDKPSYHLYITDSEDRTKLIDITSLIIKEAFPNINADNLKITVEGILEPENLKDIINFIYKRFLMPDDANGFDYKEDYDKLTDPLTKSVLLKDTDDVIYLPVTLADNVYDSAGVTIQDRLDQMTRLGFSTSYVRSENKSGQSSFEFEYPFVNYTNGGNYVEVRIGSTYIDKSRYEIIDEVDKDGNCYRATINLIDESLEYGRALNFLFIYNSSITPQSKPGYFYGGLLANGSVPTGKLEKVSDRYDLNDSTSIATSKALYNLYKACCELYGKTPDSSSSSSGDYKLTTNRYIYTAKDQETKISFDPLYFKSGDQIFVYRNGVRLFESLDYSINITSRTITLYVRTEANDRIVFESYNVEKR